MDILGDKYWNNDPLYIAKFIERFTIANSVYSQKYYLFELNSPTIGTKRVAISVDGQDMYEIPLEE